MEDCLEQTEAYLERKEPTPKETEAEAEHQEVPNEEAEVETVGAGKSRYGDRNLAVGRPREPKKRTQDDGGSICDFYLKCCVFYEIVNESCAVHSLLLINFVNNRI
jgi:hypothetical protein